MSHSFIFGQVLFSNHPIGNAPVVVKISGVAPKKLYISLEVSLDLTSFTITVSLPTPGLGRQSSLVR